MQLICWFALHEIGRRSSVGVQKKDRLKKNGHKYYDEPYLRFKGTKYEQETFFVKDPNENILEIKTLTSNPD